MCERKMSSDGLSVCCLGGVQRRFEPVEVVGHLAEVDDVPAVGTESHRRVVAGRHAGRAVDRDQVVVEDADQLAETEMAGERCRFVADALHQAAVAGDHEREVVLRLGAETGPQVRLGDRHADGVGEALAERPGGDLDAGGVAGLGMAGCGRSPLAEVLAGRRVRARSRTGTAASTAGSMRDRSTGRTGLGRARPGRRGRASSPGCRARGRAGASAMAVPW